MRDDPNSLFSALGSTPNATGLLAGQSHAPSDAHSTIFRELPRQADGPSLRERNDIQLTVSIELGRARMRLEDLLQLANGAVIELDRLAGDAVDVRVNDQLVARGEVVVLNDHFAVRLTEIVAAPSDGEH